MSTPGSAQQCLERFEFALASNQWSIPLSFRNGLRRRHPGWEDGRRRWSNFAMDDTCIKRSGLRIRWHIEFGSECIDTCLVLAERLMASACQGIELHQLAMNEFVSRVLCQQRCKEGDGPAILMGIAGVGRKSQTCLTLPAAESLTWAERPFGIAVIGQKVTSIELESADQGRLLPGLDQGLECCDIHPYRVRQGEYTILEHQGRLGCTRTKGNIEGVAQSMEGTVKVVGSGSEVDLRPEKLDDLFFQQTALQSQMLEESRSFASRPARCLQNTLPTGHFKTTKQEDADRRR